MRKDINIDLISKDSVKHILKLANKYNLEIRITEGSLLNNYLIENNDAMILAGVKRKYAVMNEVYKK